MRSLLHHKPRDAGGTLLVTRQAAVEFGVPATTNAIRKACRPIACDVVSRAVYYDLDEVAARFPRVA